MRFLHSGGGQHGKACGACRHHILVVAEDRKALCRQRTGRYMKNAGREFTGNLIHVGQHQHQSLRRGEGGGERARLESTMDGAGSAAFTLHLDNDRHIAPDILNAFGAPLIGQLGHGGGGCDGIDGAHLVNTISHIRRGFITINHRYCFIGY